MRPKQSAGGHGGLPEINFFYALRPISILNMYLTKIYAVVFITFLFDVGKRNKCDKKYPFVNTLHLVPLNYFGLKIDNVLLKA